jgi:hypothetical protein
VAYALLAELQRTLIRANAKQLHAASLVGRKAGHLTDNIAHKLDPLAQVL